MRTVALAVAGLLCLPAAALAQPTPPPPTLIPTIPVPPTTPPALPSGQPVSNSIPAPTAEPAVLPGGTDVSRPLQPVVAPPAADQKVVAPASEPPPIPEEQERDPKPGNVLGKWWDNDEILIWWPKAVGLPPLVTATRLGGPPVYNRPDTLLLVGNRALDNQPSTGYRLTVGYSLNTADTVGFEGRYFFLGTRTLSAFATDLGNLQYRAVGLPFVNALTGAEDVLSLARPGVSSGLVTVSTTTRVQGAEANVIANLYAEKGVKLHAIAGYRFFQANEGLTIEESWLQYPGPGRPKVLGAVADQFDGRNEFHGGQLGLMADLSRGMFYVEMTGKVAFGQNYEVVFINGKSHLLTAANPLPVGQTVAGGVYAQPSNIGRYTHGAFAVVPEGMFKVGFKLGDRGRFYVGYNFLYLSNAVRPGDQIDRTLNPAQIPLLGGTGLPLDPQRPRLDLVRTDFWVQGIIIGFETRF